MTATVAPLVLPPKLRQSLISQFNSCPRSARFTLESPHPYSAGLPASGTLWHRAAAECLRVMRERREEQLETDVALTIFDEIAQQHEIPPGEDPNHVPMDRIEDMRRLIYNWARYNTFSVTRIVAIERRIEHVIEVPGPGGEIVEVMVTGQPDLLAADPPEGAIFLDWKTGHAPPPVRRKDPHPEYGDRISSFGYAQQTIYGWLILMEYPAIHKVTAREFYVRKNEARAATIYRQQMERIEAVLRATLANILHAAAEGPRSPRWVAQPGAHCSFCLRPADCPIPAKERREGAPTNLDEALHLARAWFVSGKTREETGKGVKTWVDKHGPLVWDYGKKRLVVGWVKNKTGDGRHFDAVELREGEDATEVLA